MIGVIDYGLGNIKAFLNVYKKLNIPATKIKNKKDFEKISKVILPGVGSFDQAMNKLNNSGLRDELENKVLHHNIPILGICVGMQMLADSSEEGSLNGLGWINGNVKKFDITNIPYKTKIPHMGWNNIIPNESNLIMKGFNNDSKFYFLHSYYVECKNERNIISETHYGEKFSSAINKKNIFGVQFHPEKSHNNGVNLLKNFYYL